jgi:hypothetical protein
MKTCSKCNQTKPLKDFYTLKRKVVKETSKTLYHKGECKECAKLRTTKWTQQNREKVNKYQLAYYHKKRSVI